ncbi:MAG: HD domain-containing phosphohydrolase [Clostridia bacterium]
MRVSRIGFIDAVSFALDYLEIGMHQNITNHNRRVALIAINMGKLLGLTADELTDLYEYAVLHDNGVTTKAYIVMAEMGRDKLEDGQSHCVVGQKNIEHFPFFAQHGEVIRYHHEAYDGSGFFGLVGEQIPLFSQIIALADVAEIAYRKTGSRKQTIAKIRGDIGSKYAQRIGAAFLSAATHSALWLGMGDMFVSAELVRTIPGSACTIDTPELIKIARAIAAIVDAKSPFTGTHTQGIAEKIGVMSDVYAFDAEHRDKLTLAAYLHDVGKLVVPDTILDKPGKLTEDEFEIIKAHAYYTKMMLFSVPGFEEIARWAGEHHEKLNGTGYPYGLGQKDLDFESQMMACVDIYQALTEDRPYRAALSHEDAIMILSGMAKRGEVNAQIVLDMQAVGAKLKK